MNTKKEKNIVNFLCVFKCLGKINTHRLNEEIMDQILFSFSWRSLEQRVTGTNQPTKKDSQRVTIGSSRCGLGGKATTMFKHSCHFLLSVDQNPAFLEACIYTVP